MRKFNLNDEVFFITPPNTICSATVTGIRAGRYILSYGYGSGVCLPESRLYRTFEEAESSIGSKQKSPTNALQRTQDTSAPSSHKQRLHFWGGGLDDYKVKRR